jgi:hypothetical protein
MVSFQNLPGVATGLANIEQGFSSFPGRRVLPTIIFDLVLARQLAAKSLELRAATSLSRLWRDQGKCADARSLLTPVYDWFTEGLDLPDLQNARRLIDDLARPT